MKQSKVDTPMAKEEIAFSLHKTFIECCRYFFNCCLIFLSLKTFSLEYLFLPKVSRASTVIGAIGGASPKPGNGEGCVRKGIRSKILASALLF
jgi:hypothetical protein